MHLKETLHRNIRDNEGYDNAEFILLDYGSRDDLYDWAHQELQPYINSGRLIYFRTTEPKYFHMSHSKNMALRLGTGDILCSVDADNYTGQGFAAYVNAAFNKQPDIFIAPPRIGPTKRWWDVQGRVCVQRNDFYALRGYDERVMDYGYEDLDFKTRLLSSGRKRFTIKDPEFLHAIRHDNSMRIADGFSTRNTKDLFISLVEDNLSEVIYLKEDHIFERFYVSNNLLQYEHDHRGDAGDVMAEPKSMYTSTYREQNNEIQLLRENGKILMTLVYQGDDQLLSNDQRCFYRVTSALLRENFLLKRAIYVGRRIYYQNRASHPLVNSTGFGQGMVYRNFSEVAISLGNCAV